MKLFHASMAFVALGAMAFVFTPSAARSANLLSNGGLEDSAGPQGWSLTQSITGTPGVSVSAAEHVDSADIGFQPSPGVGGLGVLLKTAAGNEGTFMDQNKAVNVTLSQTVAVPAGKLHVYGPFVFPGCGFE